MNTSWFRKFASIFAVIALIGVSACGTLSGVVDETDDTFVTDLDG